MTRKERNVGFPDDTILSEKEDSKQCHLIEMD
jgi:hypothetical protein